MRLLRLLVIATATICVLSLGAFALVGQDPVSSDPGDDIIIKGGSIEIQCGKNHGNDCLGAPDLTTGRYKRLGIDNRKILRVRVRPENSNTDYYSGTFTKHNQPIIVITYR